VECVHFKRTEYFTFYRLTCRCKTEDLTNLGLARPCPSKSTVGTPNLTMRVKRDCSILEYFWNAMFLITGGNWWWSPIMIQRLSRLKPSSGFCSSKGINVSISRICADSSIRMLSYLKPENKDMLALLVQYNKVTWSIYATCSTELRFPMRSFLYWKNQKNLSYTTDQ